MPHEPLEQALIDAAKFLEDQALPYALIGGLAVSVRGQPRATADVNMIISADVTRSLQLATSLEGTGFQLLFDGVAEVVERSFILPLLHRATRIKIDLALGLSGFERQVISRAERLNLAGAIISVATAEDLLLMKVLAGRPQDQQDVRGLAIVQGEHLDWGYCLTIAAGLEEALGYDLAGSISALRSEFGP